jgi:hypothetical protein
MCGVDGYTSVSLGPTDKSMTFHVKRKHYFFPSEVQMHIIVQPSVLFCLIVMSVFTRTTSLSLPRSPVSQAG